VRGRHSRGLRPRRDRPKLRGRRGELPLRADRPRVFSGLTRPPQRHSRGRLAAAAAQGFHDRRAAVARGDPARGGRHPVDRRLPRRRDAWPPPPPGHRGRFGCAGGGAQRGRAGARVGYRRKVDRRQQPRPYQFHRRPRHHRTLGQAPRREWRRRKTARRREWHPHSRRRRAAGGMRHQRHPRRHRPHAPARHRCQGRRVVGL
ncbi:uncharacterized protein METZ01_LOCUS516320, partial [marine metagenome]